MLPGVSKTAILTLRARAEEHQREDRLLEDPVASDWLSRVDWPAQLDEWFTTNVQQSTAWRANDLDHIVYRYTQAHPGCAVVELGCGLSTRSHRLSLDVPHWVDVDLPEVIELRRKWGVGGEKHALIASSVLNHSWMDQLPQHDPASYLFVAEGLLYYLPRDEVDALLGALAERFPGSALLQDVLGAVQFPTMRELSIKAGAPIVWSLERPLSQALEAFGLDEIEGYAPVALAQEALERSWPRLDKKSRGLLFLAMQMGDFFDRKSGNILGRLRAKTP